jgi:hypothetical protein
LLNRTSKYNKTTAKRQPLKNKSVSFDFFTPGNDDPYAMERYSLRDGTTLPTPWNDILYATERAVLRDATMAPGRECGSLAPSKVAIYAMER